MMSEIDTSPAEIIDQLRVAYQQIGEHHPSRLGRISLRPMRRRGQSKYVFIDVKARELVACMLHVDPNGLLYRERGGGFGVRRHLVPVEWKNLDSYERGEAATALAKLNR